MVEGLQAPGEGYRYLEFSDGEGAWISPKATNAQWKQIKDQGEAERDAKYTAQAKAEDRPITTKGKVYSATVVRPAGIHSQLMAWIDHHLGGNALNANPTAQAINTYAAPIAGGVSRIGTAALERNPYVAATDLSLTGVNVAKHLAAKAYPGVNVVPDLPTVLSQVRGVVGTPELEPDASAGQRVLENAASTLVGGGPSEWTREAIADQVARAGLSHIGGLAGEEVGGEAGQFGGSFVGGAPGSARAIAQRTLAPFFRGRTTADVSGAAARQGIQPSLGSVSGAMGRLFTKAVAATPGVGGGVREANDRFTEAIRQRQREIATDVYGDTLPGNISDEDIGGALIAGARQGSANITQRATTEQQQLIHGAPAQPARPATPTPPPSPSLPLDEHELFMMQERARGNGVPGPTTPGQPAQPATPGIGANAPVDARSVYYGPAGYSNTALHGDPSTYPAYKARLDNIRQTAIQAQQPFWQNFWGQLAAGEIPYERFQALRSNLGADLEGYSGMTGGQKDQLYEAMTNAMREAARARGGQALVDRFDAANANYKRLIGDEGQRSKLEAIGGAPQSGGWDQFFGPQGQTRPAVGVDFTGGKGEEGAAEWFKGHLQSPEKLAPFADPTIVPNEFWRRVVGQWLATRGQTKEGTFRPDQMAAELSGGAPGAEISTNKGVGGTVSTQLFTGPQGSTTANINDVNDIATLGRNSVVAQNRAGLTDAAGSVYALKWLADQAQHAFGAAGGLGTMLLAGRNLSDPDFVNAVRGQGTPLVNSLYAGVPAATQNILQYQTNPPAAYDPLGYSVTAGQSPQ